jgi:hypothetical protein
MRLAKIAVFTNPCSLQENISAARSFGAPQKNVLTSKRCLAIAILLHCGKCRFRSPAWGRADLL